MNCCQAWEDAQEAGTDNEEYSTLLRKTSGTWQIGASFLPPVNFCPWCGADKRKPDDETGIDTPDGQGKMRVWYP